MEDIFGIIITILFCVTALKTQSNTFTKTKTVGIGTLNPDEKPAVKSKTHSVEVIVDLNVPGPDYVFEADYNLTSLEELEAYINTDKHLSKVSAANELETNRITLREMSLLLLKKNKELILQFIEENEMNRKQV